MLWFAKLVLRNASRSRRRTLLAALSVAVAIFLFVFFDALFKVWSERTDRIPESARRLVVRHRSPLSFMPEAHRGGIAKVPGVTLVHARHWFGGRPKDRPRDLLVCYAVELETFEGAWGEYKLAPGLLDAWSRQRDGAIVGARLLARYGWRVGQRVTLTSNVFPDLEVTVAITGTYDRGPDAETFLFQRRYLQELLRGTPYFGTVGSFVVVVADERDLPRVIQAIDARFETSEAPTKTETEKEFLLNALNVVGDVRVVIQGVTWVALAVVFFIVTSSMAGSVRERASEIAVLKTLGFAPRTVAALVAFECVLVAVLGGAIASLGTRVVFHDLLGRPTILRYFPEFAPPWTTVLAGLGLSLGLGLVAGVWPAVLAARVPPAQGLRRV